MTIKFQMKVNELFRIGEKTIFAGALDTTESVISNMVCALEIDGQEVGKIHIDGEVSSGSGHRDLWTSSHVDLDRELLGQHEVILIAR